MTSLAVRLETSSTSQKGERQKRQTEREGGGTEEEGKQEKGGKNIRQAAQMHLQFQNKLLKVRALQRSHALGCAQNHFQIIHHDPVAVILTDIHGS